MIKTILIGLDAFDPILFEAFSERGILPNLSGLAEKSGYSRLSVSNPPQSEVSWTSIATGLNPGSHGMFDFVHRDPESYGLQVSLLQSGKSLSGLQFVRPYNARTIFDITANQGYPSTSLWWPATFPARPESPVRTLPGLGTPDIQGRLGVGAYYSTDPQSGERRGKTPVFSLHSNGKSNLSSEFQGPMVKKQQASSHLILPFQLSIIDDQNAVINFSNVSHSLKIGEWSPILELEFKVSWFASVRAITRVILISIGPDVQMYALPLQIHPLHPLWRYGTPASFVKDSWRASGPFLTLGWPQDTTGLEDGCISDEQFLTLCDSIFIARKNLFFHLADQFDEGLLASVFDSLDRIQHMFLLRRPDVIESWYVRLDRLVGDIQQRLKNTKKGNTRLLVVSDHGFSKLNSKIHLNRWLLEKGYLSKKDPSDPDEMKSIDWSSTRAYAVGLNSLYLNLQGREKSGVVTRAEIEPLTKEIQKELISWKTSDSSSIVSNAWKNEEIFEGSMSSYGPDLLIGYATGFRGSGETGLGSWKDVSIEPNHDHWEADHCFDAAHVPGVIFSSEGLRNFSHPSYKDIPELAINAAPDSDGKNAASEVFCG